MFYQTEGGHARIQVRLEDETVWLTQQLMAELYQTSKQNISLHLRNIFLERKIDEEAVVKEYLTTASHGKKYGLRNEYCPDALNPWYFASQYVGKKEGTQIINFWKGNRDLLWDYSWYELFDH